MLPLIVSIDYRSRGVDGDVIHAESKLEYLTVLTTVKCLTVLTTGTEKSFTVVSTVKDSFEFLQINL